MAISGEDGSIILTTKVDTNGIDKGVNNIRSATEKTNKSVKNLGIELSKALSAGDAKSAQLINNFKKATEEVEKQSAKVDELKSKLQGLESGEIKVEDKGAEKLQRDFEQANISIEKTKNEISEVYLQLDNLQRNAFKTPSGDIFFTNTEQAEFDRLNARLDELEPKLEQNKQRANELGVALRNATGTATQTEIEKTKSQLAEAESKLQNLSTKAEIAEQKMNGGMQKYHKEVSSTETAISRLGKRIGGLVVSALIFSAITKAFTELRKTIGAMLMSNEEFRNSVYTLQASLWTLAQPIYQSVLPALQSLMGWLTKAILYVATFFSALGGKTLKQTIASAKALNSQATAYKNVASASKEARKQLAGFDDLNILQGGTATTGAGLSGVNSYFDDLESLLNDADMKKLQDFEEWVITHSDSIKTGLEIAGLGLLGLAIGGVISKIGDLLGWFKKKDKGLDTQTAKTREETQAVRELSSAWSLAPALAFGLIPALDGLTQSGANFVPVFGDAKYSIEDFCENSKLSFNSWAKSVQGNAVNTANVVADNIYNSLFASGNNINDFIETSSSNFKKWADSVSTNVSNTAKTIAENWGNSLSSAWENFKNFAIATGEKITTTWKEYKATIVGTTLVASAVAKLFNFSKHSGGSLIPAYAKGTIVPPNKPHLALFGDNKQEPEIVSPVSTMKQAFTEAMIEMGGNFGGGNTEVVLEIDGREFGRAVVEQGNRENRRIGTRLVIA